MIAGDAPREASESVKSVLGKYTSAIGEIGANWEGDSHDSIIPQTEEFVSEYEPISSQLTSLGSACDDFIKYKKTKDYKKELDDYLPICESEWSDPEVVGEKTNPADIRAKIEECQKEIETLEQSINSSLDSANSVTLTASSTSAGEGSSVSITPSTPTTPASVSGNLSVSSVSGYVFPFENGVYAPVTSGVGPRWGTNHNGTDIGVPIGTEVHSLSSGTVLNAGEAQGYGQWVRIQQDDGNIVTYGHVSKYDFFQEGDRVNAGDVIALSGNEGDSTGPHLHLQIEDANGGILDSEELMSDLYSYE